MKHRLEKDGDTHSFLCECGFLSSGHRTKALADARGKEHEAEHETKQPMRAIGDFMADQE